MRQGIAVATFVAVLTGACGTQPTTPPETGGTSTTATIPSHSPGVIDGPTGTVDVVVQEPAERAATAVRYLRLEDSTGEPVLEREYREAPAELAETVAVGDYRVVSWLRDCGGGCAGKTDEELGQPIGICGTKVAVTENAVSSVTVDARAGANCTMTVGR